VKLNSMPDLPGDGSRSINRVDDIIQVVQVQHGEAEVVTEASDGKEDTTIRYRYVHKPSERMINFKLRRDPLDNYSLQMSILQA
jgi:hypothetical protein